MLNKIISRKVIQYSINKITNKVVNNNIIINSNYKFLSSLTKTNEIVGSNSLSETLLNELSAEEENKFIDQDFLDIQNLIESKYKVIDEPGISVIELTRTQGDVNVRIVFDVQDKEDVEPAYDDAEDDNEEEEEKEDEEFNEEDDETGVPFQVILEKNSNKVIVDAIAAQNYQIKNIQFVPGDKQIDDQKLYGGPVFDDLDEKLSDKFFDYLNEYGINDDISFYIVAKSAHKEQQEYELWLKNLHNFVNK